MRSASRLRRSLFAMIALLSTIPASAYRREYRVTYSGERKSGSEVCFYRGNSAADALSLFFFDSRVSCLPADEVLDFPPGLFHVFARHSDGLASGHRDYFVYSGEPVPERGYELLEIPLERAGIVDFGAALKVIKAGQSVGVWLAQTPQTRGTFLPLVNGETSVMVPAGVPVLPLLIENHQPIAAGSLIELEAGESRRVETFDPAAGHDLMVWTKLDHSSQAPRIAPLIRLGISGGEREIPPLVPLYDPSGATNTLLFFKNVSSSEGVLTVRGDGWLARNYKVSLRTGLTILGEPILLSTGVSLVLRWAANPLPACAGGKGPALVAHLLHCAASATRCSTASAKSVPWADGQLVFDGVAPGEYRVDATPPFSATIKQDVRLELGREAALALPITPFGFFGRVTLNGHPLQARVVFESGEAATDSLGQYEAHLAADPLQNLVRILDCQTAHAYTYIPKDRIASGAPFDIALDTGALEISVRDERDRPLADAAVHFSVVKRIDAGQPVVYYSSATVETDQNGVAKFNDAPAGAKMIACASHRGFASACTDPLSDEEQRAGATRLQLRPVAMRGRVNGSIGNGLLAWVLPTGVLSEIVQLQADGRFETKTLHDGHEYIIYTSDRQPLIMLSDVPASDVPDAQDELSFTIPNVRARTVAIELPSRTRPGFVGLWIGERYVPLQVLAFHEDPRGHDIHTDGTTVILEDIAETAPLFVAFAPDNPAARTFVDYFTLPEYSGIKRQPVSGSRVSLTP